MFNPSNLYAEKIFAEHPLELWSLDDRNDYVSLIKESSRLLEFWTVSVAGDSATPTIDDLDSFTEAVPPIEDTQISQVSITPSDGFETLSITLTSPTTFEVNEAFAIGLSLYANPNVTGVKVGYKVGTSTPEMSPSKTVHELEWSPVSYTFPTAPSGPAKVVIQITMSEASTSGLQYDNFVTGISVGVLSQEFSGSSVGISPMETKPSIPGMSGTSWDAYEAISYGLSENSGYYIIDGDRLRARSSTVPMVFGAVTSTVLEKASNGNPSLVVPGMQFLNSAGKKFDRTFECWLRINSFSTDPKRILGPTTNTDGLYAHGPFLLLKIGDSYGSHYVGEWSRPMLVDISVSKTKASLMVNAETVVSIDIDLDSATLPEPEDDWLGFYCHDEVPSVEVDCVAVYGYIVPETVAKKRYVYAQGVVLPESTNTSYGGSSMVIDYAFANYDKNYSFPKNSKWEFGFTNNLLVDKTRISAPAYSLPEIFLGDRSLDVWLEKMGDEDGEVQEYNDISADHRSIIRMRPSTIPGDTGFLDDEFSTVYPYILIKDLSLLYGSRASGFYGTFGIDKDSSEDQTLLLVKDKTSSSYLKIIANENIVSYVINGTLVESFTVTETLADRFEKVSVGIDIEKFRQSSASAFSLFSDTSNLSLYIGGEPQPTNPDKTFSGNIYEIGVMSKTDIDNTSTAFTSSGLVDANTSNTTTFSGYRSAYVFIATKIIGTVRLDIASSGYWEDNIPLSLFKSTLDGQDKVSFIQANIDYPEMTKYTNGDYDTSEALVRFFVAFQRVDAGPTMTSGRTSVPMKKIGTVKPTSSWKTEKYEIVDGAIIFAPDIEADSLLLEDVNVILSMEFSIDGINLNPVTIRDISLSSISFDEQSLRGVGTKFGTQIYPFGETSEDVYVSIDDNPYKIYKGTSPYLYLTSKTGINVVGDFYEIDDPDYVHRGVLVKVNESLANPYSLSSAVMFFRHNDLQFPENKMPIFEIEGRMSSAADKKNAYLRFFVQASNSAGTRGVITCQLRLGDDEEAFEDYDGIDYYWNGNRVATPELTANEWGILALSFHDLINLDDYEGRIEIHGNQLVNNLSVYSASQSALQSSAITNTWNSARYGAEDWETVLDTDGMETPNVADDDNNWFQVNTTIKSSIKPANPTEIYRTYLGINKIIVDSSIDSSYKAVRLQDCEYILYNTVGWNKNTQKPV